MLNRTFILRQLTTARKQSLIFVLCVALSLVTLVALRGFGDSINRALLRDAKQLQASDLFVRASFSLSQPVLDTITRLVAEEQVESAHTYEFLSVVRVAEGEATQLANLKVVERGYPFYGQVMLASGRGFATVLTPGSVIVEQALLDRLDLQVGDRLQIGQATLTIVDVVLQEPDRPINLFSFGLRIFINSADLDALQLVKPGSRVNYKVLLKVNDENNLNRLATTLKRVVEPQEEVETYRTAQSGAQRFFDNFLFFLSLVGIFTFCWRGLAFSRR